MLRSSFEMNADNCFCHLLQIVVNLGYGRQDKARYSDPDIQKVILGAERLGAVLRPGAWKIDSFPWLKCELAHPKPVRTMAMLIVPSLAQTCPAT